MSDRTELAVGGSIALIFLGYFSFNGLMFLMRPARWGRSRWSLYPPQFLYILDSLLGKLQVRALGFLFLVAGLEGILAISSRLSGAEVVDRLADQLSPFPNFVFTYLFRLFILLAALNGLMYIIRPRDWATSRYSLKLWRSPSELRTPRSLWRLRLWGLVMMLFALACGKMLL